MCSFAFYNTEMSCGIGLFVSGTAACCPSVLMVKLPRVVVLLDYGLSRPYVGTIQQLLHLINLQLVSSVLHKVSTACSVVTSLVRKPMTNCAFQHDISEVVY